MHHVDVIRIPCRGPGDTSGLDALIDSGRIDAAEIVAIIGKTEGNGCVNDYTREYATTALAACLGRRLSLAPEIVEKRVAFVMSGGTEGVLSPHITVFTRRAASASSSTGKRLTLGIAFTRDFLPEEIGRRAQIEATTLAVRAAMADGGIEASEDVHFVQVKCPLLTSGKISAARARDAQTITADTYESMGYSRGASSLGVAVATGEVADDVATDAAVLADWSLNSTVASASAGIELEHNVVIVLGMSSAASSPYVMAHDVMKDAIDGAAVRRALRALDIGEDELTRVVNVFAKAEASPDGLVRGQRHTMLVDSDINATRHARAATGAVVASVAGHGMVYVSGGAEHQGPPGGGPVAVIAHA